MRPPASLLAARVALVVAVALVAGCAQPADTTPTASTPGPAPAFEEVHIRHDYASGVTETKSFSIPEAPGRYFFRINHEGPQGSNMCAGDVHIQITLPNGTRYTEADFPVGSTNTHDPGGQTCDRPLVEETVAMAPGTWVVTFSGRGLGTGVVDVSLAK